LPEKQVGGERYFIYFAKMTQYSRLFTAWAKLDHVVMHVQYSSGVTN